MLFTAILVFALVTDWTPSKLSAQTMLFDPLIERIWLTIAVVGSWKLFPFTLRVVVFVVVGEIVGITSGFITLIANVCAGDSTTFIVEDPLITTEEESFANARAVPAPFTFNTWFAAPNGGNWTSEP